MRPGREIDCRVASEIFGHRVYVKKGILHEETPQGERPLRRYTKEMDSAWEIAEKLRISLIPVEEGQWFALVGGESGWRSPADFIQYLSSGKFANAGAAVSQSAPLSICLAGLNSVDARKVNAEEDASASDERSAEPDNVAKIH